MDRYQRVERPRAGSDIKENEIRITSQGLIRNYITYATSLLQERRVREIVFKAMGQAISKAVAVAEILKKRIPGLHQDISISSISITDVWEPIEEGLVPLETTRHVSMISISLSTKELNKNSPGYQAPSHVEQPKQQRNYHQQYQPQQQQHQHQPKQGQGQFIDDSYGRGRGRGRGRGWARGGYGGGYGGGYSGGYGGGYGGYDNYQGSNYQENGGWNWNNGRGRGRGRGGWGYRGAGYEGGRGAGAGGGGRGYGRGRGRMGGRGRGYYA